MSITAFGCQKWGLLSVQAGEMSSCEEKKQKEKYFQFTLWLVANWLTFQNPVFTHLTFFTLNERDWKHWRKCVFRHRKKHHLNLFWMEMKSAFWLYLWVIEPQSPFVCSSIMYTGAKPESRRLARRAAHKHPSEDTLCVGTRLLSAHSLDGIPAASQL